jgi:predicted ATPase
MREALDMLTGDIEPRWASGSITNQQATKLWHCLPVIIETLATYAPMLVGTLLTQKALVHRIEDAGLRVELGQHLIALNRQESTIHHQEFIFQQYLDFLIAVSTIHPLIIILEDLQWADPSTMDLLSFLASHLKESQILIVGTYRPSDLPRQPVIDKPDLVTILREIKRKFGNIWIDLDQREPGEDEAFVEALLKIRSHKYDQDFVQRLTRHTGGHPLFVVELLKNLQLPDQLRCNSISSTEIDWNTLPARVEAVIEMRLSRLDDRTCDILKAASVVGEEFMVGVVASVLGKSELEIYQTVDTLITDQALLVNQGVQEFKSPHMTTLRFRHLLFQRYIYNNLSEVEKRALHEKIGLALESFYSSDLYQPDDLNLQLAYHYTKASMNIKASDYLLEAGNQAVRMGAHAQAIQHFKKGLNLLKALPKTQDKLHQEISLYLAMHSPLQAQKGYADPELELLGQKVKHLCNQVESEDPLLSALYFLRVTHKAPQERELALQKARKILDDSNQSDPLLRSIAHWTLGVEMSYRGEFLIARNHLEATKDLYKSHENPWCVFLFGNDPGIASRTRLSWVLWCLGYPTQATEESQRALELAIQLDHSVVLGFAIGIGGVLFNQIRRNTEAVKAWNWKSIKHSKKEQMQQFYPGETISRGWVLTQMGQISEGLEMMESGLEAWQQSNAIRHYTQYLGMLAEGYSQAGYIDKALGTLEQSLAMVESSQERYFEAELHRLTGETLRKRSTNNDRKAEACFQSAIKVAQTQHAKSWELRATTSLCRLWFQQARPNESYQPLLEIYNWFGEGFNTLDLQEAKDLLTEIHA